MPNHVTNKIIITSANAQEALNFMKGSDREFDFNQIIPMPESLNIQSGTVTDAALAYCLTDGLTKPVTADQIEKYYKEEFFSSKAEQVERAIESAKRCLDQGHETKEQLLEIGKKVISNVETHNCHTWYEWSPQNWGTKWNAYDITVSENQVEFDTSLTCINPKMPKGRRQIVFWQDGRMNKSCQLLWFDFLNHWLLIGKEFIEKLSEKVEVA